MTVILSTTLERTVYLDSYEVLDRDSFCFAYSAYEGKMILKLYFKLVLRY